MATPQQTYSQDDQDRSVAAMAALYEAERSDGSGIFATSLQLMAAMLVVAGVAATLLPTEFASRHPKAMLCIPVLAWGLTCYTVIINALMAARVHSIKRIEDKLLKIAAQGGYHLGDAPVGSDAGDWASNITRTPMILKICSLLAYLSAYASVIGVSAYVVVDTAPRVPTIATISFTVGYSLTALLVLAGFWFIYSGRMIKRMVP